MILRSRHPAATPPPPPDGGRRAFAFIVVTALLTSIGFGLIIPIGPFLVGRYVADDASAASVLGWLGAIYAVCALFAAPILGAASDRFGRRPILVLCMAGSAVGYLLFGLAGSIAMLFAGRIVDGITGGNMSVAMAYVADVTEPSRRARRFGLIGALSGVGFILGPAVGGLLGSVDPSLPVFIAAAASAANTVLGLVAMPESLPPERRRTSLALPDLNPFSVVQRAATRSGIGRILGALFLYSLAMSAMSAIIALLAIDRLGWGADAVGLIFVLVGVSDIVVQGVLLPRVTAAVGEASTIAGSLLGVGAGLGGIAAVALGAGPVALVVAVAAIAVADGLFGPTINARLAHLTGEDGHGEVQGALSGVHSLAFVVGPVAAGTLYGVAPGAPFAAGAAACLLALLALAPSLRAGVAPAPGGDGSVAGQAVPAD